jgi:N-acetylneuraminic acid mutarotase
MFPKQNAAILWSLCAALAACDGAPGPDLTAPEAGGGMADEQRVKALAPSNTWATKRNLRAARHSMVAGAINNVIYVVGGRNAAGNSTPTLQAYDLATNIWSARRSLPAARWWAHGASTLNGQLYVAGGYGSTGGPSKTLYVYDPAANAWMRKADMPEVGCCGAQKVIGGQLYVYNGAYNHFFRYNPGTNSWVTLAPPPSEHLFGVAGVIGGRFYLTGGETNDPANRFNSSLHVYNPATNTWSTRASIPAAVTIYMHSGVLAGKFYVAGGLDDNGEPTGTLRVYTPGTNSWTTKAPMPGPRYLGAAAVAGGMLFVIGGSETGFDVSRKVEAYTP